MTTAICRKISTTPTSSWSASAARRRRRPRSISPIAGSRPPMCRWCPASRFPPQLEAPTNAFVVGLVASRGTHRASPPEPRDRARRTVISRIMSTAKRSPPRSPRRAQLCARHGWPIIDVTRRSIEETAAAIIRLYHDREAPVLDSMSGFLQAGRPPLILASASKIAREDSRSRGARLHRRAAGTRRERHAPGGERGRGARSRMTSPRCWREPRPRR